MIFRDIKWGTVAKVVLLSVCACSFFVCVALGVFSMRYEMRQGPDGSGVYAIIFDRWTGRVTFIGNYDRIERMEEIIEKWSMETR